MRLPRRRLLAIGAIGALAVPAIITLSAQEARASGSWRAPGRLTPPETDTPAIWGSYRWRTLRDQRRAEQDYLRGEFRRFAHDD